MIVLATGLERANDRKKYVWTYSHSRKKQYKTLKLKTDVLLLKLQS